MITNTRSIRDFVPGDLVNQNAESPTQAEAPRTNQTDERAAPQTSFSRGVVIALALAIPVWSWIILSLVR